MENQLVMNYTDYFMDINYGYFSYAHSYEKIGNLAVGIHYINYGKFIEADVTGEKIGAFGATEYALNLYWSRAIDSCFTFGVNIKPLASYLERYRSYGIAADAGIVYHSNRRLTTAGLVLKNMGSQITTYTRHNREPLPFEILMGVSHKLRHAPFRISVTAHQLQMPDLTYDKPEDETESEEQELLPADTLTSGSNDFDWFLDYGDKFMRHMIIGLEVIPVKGFYISMGYNYLRREELKIPERVSMVGFSWGFGIKVYMFQISYGRASYHVAGGTNHFSLSTDLNAFFRNHHGAIH